MSSLPKGSWSKPTRQEKMWRSPPSRLLLLSLLGGTRPPTASRRHLDHPMQPWAHLYSSSVAASASSSSATGGGVEVGAEAGGDSMSEAKKLMRQVNVDELKRKLGVEGEEVIGYLELLEACVEIGVVRSREEASAFARVLDEAGAVLLFGDKVYLHPDKVLELVRRAVPLVPAPDSDSRREELKELQEKKEEIDMLAHKQVRYILWSGLGFFVFQVGLFFRLTFWEFSWDVMEPVAFFTTTTGLLVGYAYSLVTSRDPTYRDFMNRLFLSRQRKLFLKKNFDRDKFKELQKHCKCPLEHIE